MPDTTQSRFLTASPTSSMRSSTGSILPSTFPLLRSAQMTESFRSGPSDTQDFQAVAREFQRTTRNGFTYQSRFDSGHPFFTTKTTYRLSHTDFKYEWRTGTRAGWSCSGVVCPNVGKSYLVPSVDSHRLTAAERTNYGARAIAGTAPTNPNASISTFLGEFLFEGLPSLAGAAVLKDRAQKFHSYGGEYLNVQFGWVPFVAELMKLVRSCKEAFTLLQQYERDAGRVVRRRFVFPDIITFSDVSDARESGQSGYFNTTWGVNPGFMSTAERSGPVPMEMIKRRSISFVGAYSYALPVDDNIMGKIARFEQEANYLLGTRLTPELLWELAPWSWLVDWFSTVGLLVGNAERLSTDGLVLRYGYLLHHTVEDRTFRVPAKALIGGGLVGPVTLRTRRESKERVRASPYGFALLPADFSASQWAILAALGLTKSPGRL